MAWDPTIPANNADLLSPPVRGNFVALDTLLVAPLTALANGQVLYKAAGPVIAGVPPGTNGYILTLVGGVPLWQPAPTSGFTNPMTTPGDLIYGGVAGVATRLARVDGGLLLGGNPPVYSFAPVLDQTLFTAAAAPATPPAGKVATYAKTDKLMYQKDDAGVETRMGPALSVLEIPLRIEAGTFPDGTGLTNAPPEMIREVSTAQLVNTPKRTRTFAKFDAGDALCWGFQMPANYGSGGTIRGKCKATTATTGTIIWSGGIGATVDSTTDDDALQYNAEDVAAAVTVPATQGQVVEFSIALTMTNVAANRDVSVFLMRKGGTIAGAGAAILMSAKLEYTPAA